MIRATRGHADDQLARLVLAWVNDLRREHELGDRLARLPSGRMRDAEHCVVARALHMGHCVVEDDILILRSRIDGFGDYRVRDERASGPA